MVTADVRWILQFIGSFCRYRSTDYVSLCKTKEIKDSKKKNPNKDYSLKKDPQFLSFMVAAGFVPWRVRPHIDSISCQVLKMYLSLTDKKDNIVCTMKQNHTKHVCFTFFDPLKFTMSSWGQTRTRWVRTPH